MQPDVVQNQVGIPVRVALVDTVGEPVTIPEGATLEILVRPPRGPVRSWAANAFGPDADGVLEHVLEAGDLDQFGRYGVQGHVEAPGLDLRGLPFEIEVGEAYDA